MAGRIAERFIGLQDDDKDASKRNTVSTSIWKQGYHPG